MLEYKELEQKYSGFQNADFVVYINEKDFSKNMGGAHIDFIEIELSSGFDASMAAFQIHDCYCEYPGYYEVDEIIKFMQLGSAVDIYLGYKNQVKEVFLGVITRVNFIYEDRDDPYIQVTAMDVKAIMMANCCTGQLKAVSYGEAVNEIFGKPAYEKLKSESVIRKLSISDTPDKKAGGKDQASSKTIDMESESDYEFVVKAAKRYYYEFFINCGTIHFRKAKEEKNILMEIGIESGLISFDIRYDITGLVELVEVRASEQGKAGDVSASNKLNNKISTGSRAKSLISGSKRVQIDAVIATKEEAQKRAEYLAEDISYRFAGLRLKMTGIPELVPGNFIKISGMKTPSDNQFYLTNVIHQLDLAGGYTTTIIGNGMSVES